MSPDSPGRSPTARPGGAEDGVRIGGEDVGEDLGMGERDGVAGIVAPDAPAVADDQDEWGSAWDASFSRRRGGCPCAKRLSRGRGNSDRRSP